LLGSLHDDPAGRGGPFWVARPAAGGPAGCTQWAGRWVLPGLPAEIALLALQAGIFPQDRDCVQAVCTVQIPGTDHVTFGWHVYLFSLI